MLRFGRRCRGERGAAIVVVAPMLVGFCVLVALVVDLGNARQVANHGQASVDAGALAGARELPLAGHDAAAASAAKAQAAAVLHRNLTNTAGTPTQVPCGAGVPPNSTCYEIDDADVVVASPYVGTWASAPFSHSLIYAEVCQPTPTFFADVAGLRSPTVCRDAVARRFSATGGYGYGLVVLEPTTCGALKFRGDSETVLSSNGAVMVNSSCVGHATGAMDSSGSKWDLVAEYIGVVGNATLSPCDPESADPCTSSVPIEGIAPFEDPIGVTAPDPTTMPTRNTCGDTVLLPGRYPNECRVNSGNRILRPGTYYFNDGFHFNGGSIVCSNTATSFPIPATSTCDGVTLVVGGGSFTLNGNGKVDLPPPTTGPYAGISVHQVTGATSKINGTADFNLGTIYAPSAVLEFSGSGGGKEVNIYGQVVGRMIDIGGTFNFNIEVPLDAPDAVPEESIGLEH